MNRLTGSRNFRASGCDKRAASLWGQAHCLVVGYGQAESGAAQSEDQCMTSLADRYGPNWQEVLGYIEGVPTGFMLNDLGQPHASEGLVSRVRSWSEMERIVHIDPENGSPENSPYLFFLTRVDKASRAIRELTEHPGIFEQAENAGVDAGTEYADESEDWPDRFYEWLDSEPEGCQYFYRSSIQDHVSYIARAITLGRRPETEVLYELWYWYRAGHWPCGWKGNWPEGRLIVF